MKRLNAAASRDREPQHGLAWFRIRFELLQLNSCTKLLTIFNGEGYVFG
jgi:hypothetical protein